MFSERRPLILVLLVLCCVHILALAWREWLPMQGMGAFLYPDGTPVGGDFINLWSAGRLALAGQIDVISQPDAFMASQIDFIGAPIGHRVWAYPPHSLFLAMPFAMLDYYPALLTWSALGLIVLALGCRRLGFGASETAVVLLSPASVLCLYYGQTGNLAAGLLLLALSARPGRDMSAIGAAAMLTIKPQMGFLLPLYWLAERRFAAIAATSALVLAILALSIWRFGLPAWPAYIGDTLHELSQLERHGSGPFMNMIPSIFMALRILTGDGDLAIQLHLLLAVPILAFALWRLWRLDDARRRIVLVLVSSVLVTPYMHNYDLSILIVAGLSLLRRFDSGSAGEKWAERLAIAMLVLPQLVVLFNASGWPISPLLILPLLFLA